MTPRNKLLPGISVFHQEHPPTHHLTQAGVTRHPLFLHNRRLLAIKSAIPKLEEFFNPDKHFNSNRKRADSSRLHAEFKREKKGRDAAYEQKYKRLVAGVQSEQGRAAKEYEKVKRLVEAGESPPSRLTQTSGQYNQYLQ